MVGVGVTPGGRRKFHLKKTGVLKSYLLGVKKVVLVPLRVFSLKRAQWQLLRYLN